MATSYLPGSGLNPFTTSFPPEIAPRPPMTGSGSPEGRVRANPGTGYTDSVSGHLWVKFSGVQELGWKDVGLPGPASVGGGGGGDTQVFAGTGSPVGVVVPKVSAAYYTQTDSVPPGIIWSWYSGAWH